VSALYQQGYSARTASSEYSGVFHSGSQRPYEQQYSVTDYQSYQPPPQQMSSSEYLVGGGQSAAYHSGHYHGQPVTYPASQQYSQSGHSRSQNRGQSWQ